MPQYWNKKVLLAKIEATYGTDPVPPGGDPTGLVKSEPAVNADGTYTFDALLARTFTQG